MSRPARRRGKAAVPGWLGKLGEKLGDKITDKVLALVVVPLLGTIVARWSTDILAVVWLQAVLVGSLLIVLPAVLWSYLRRRIGVPAVLTVCVASDLLIMLVALHLTHKSIGVDQGLMGRQDLAGKFQGPGVTDIRHSDYNTIHLLKEPTVVERGNVELQVIVAFTWTTRTPALDPLCDGRSYEGSARLVAQGRSSVAGGGTYDPSTIGDFSTVPQRGWCPYLFGWLETPMLLAEAGFITRWADERINAAP